MTPNADEDGQSLDPSHAAGENVKCHGRPVTQFGSFLYS